MTNISKKHTKGEDYVVAHKKLVELISKLKPNNAAYLVDELLTESEQIMIVKRFATILMYKQNYSPYRVSNTIAISLSTAQRLHRQFNAGMFNNLLDCISKKEQAGFINLINDLIIAQASPRARARLMNRAL